MDMRPKAQYEPVRTVPARRAAGKRLRKARRPAKTKVMEVPRVVPATPDPSFLRDSFASTAFAETMDRTLNATVARYSTGLSPMALVAAYWDWASHLAFAPGLLVVFGVRVRGQAWQQQGKEQQCARQAHGRLLSSGR